MSTKNPYPHTSVVRKVLDWFEVEDELLLAADLGLQPAFEDIPYAHNLVQCYALIHAARRIYQ